MLKIKQLECHQKLHKSICRTSFPCRRLRSRPTVWRLWASGWKLWQKKQSPGFSQGYHVGRSYGGFYGRPSHGSGPLYRGGSYGGSYGSVGAYPPKYPAQYPSPQPHQHPSFKRCRMPQNYFLPAKAFKINTYRYVDYSYVISKLRPCGFKNTNNDQGLHGGR